MGNPENYSLYLTEVKLVKEKISLETRDLSKTQYIGTNNMSM